MPHLKIRNYVKVIEVKDKEHIVLLTHFSSLTINFHELLGLLSKLIFLKSVIICDRSTIFIGFCCIFIFIVNIYEQL